MRFKIKRVCILVISVQVFVIVLNIQIYQSFTGLYSSKENVSHFYPSVRKYGIQQTTGNTKLYFKNKINGNTSWNRIAEETITKRRFTNKPVTNIMKRTNNVSKSINNKNQNPTKKINWLVRKCNQFDFPSHLEDGDNWQTVDNHTAFVFSSYYEDKTRTIIILGARSRLHVEYSCLLWHENNGQHSIEQVDAKVKQLPESHSLRFSAVFFECKRSVHNKLPSHVSLVRTPCSAPANIMKLHSTVPAIPYPRRFTVCLTPLNTKYSRAYELVEWIELNRILGAEKFIIYNYSISDNVAQVLDYYIKTQLVDVIPWRLPVRTETNNGTKLPEIHYFGQTIALNDCLYRNKAESEYIINTDLDEFIVPHDQNVSIWSDMLKQLPSESGAYIFRSTFYRKEWDNVYLTQKEMIDRYRLITLQKLHHEENIFPAKRRSKYFARTFDCRQVMIHSVQYLPTKKKAHSVDKEVGLVHHYRGWENEMSLPEMKVFDDTIPRKYSKLLIDRVSTVWSSLKHVKMDSHNFQ